MVPPAFDELDDFHMSLASSPEPDEHHLFVDGLIQPE
jgi:hypothetical protein